MPVSQDSRKTSCKYCGTYEIVKCGSYKGTPRYLCKLCGRKFKDDDHAFRMSVPAEYINRALNLYYEGMRVNEIRNDIQRNFSYHPPATLIHFWIDKYTDKAEQMIKNYQPQVGDTWLAGEMITRVGKQRYWIYEIIDDETCYLLASLITTRSAGVINNLIQKASQVAGKAPKMVMVYMPMSSFNAIEKDSEYALEHIPWETFAINHRTGIVSDANIHRIRNLQYFRKLKTANRFFSGLAIHYNYFTINEKCDGRTPARAARIKYPFHSWKELIEQSTSACLQ